MERIRKWNEMEYGIVTEFVKNENWTWNWKWKWGSGNAEIWLNITGENKEMEWDGKEWNMETENRNYEK